ISLGVGRAYPRGGGPRSEGSRAERYFPGASLKLLHLLGKAPIRPHEARAAGERSRRKKFRVAGSQKSGSPTSVSAEGRVPIAPPVGSWTRLHWYRGVEPMPETARCAASTTKMFFLISGDTRPAQTVVPSVVAAFL